jgi:hypothetical protein
MIFYQLFIQHDGSICGIGPWIEEPKIRIEYKNEILEGKIIDDPHKNTLIVEYRAEIQFSNTAMIKVDGVETQVCEEEYEPLNCVASTLFKNCSPFLEDWILYHNSIGVEHFYLYDNNSEDYECVERICKKYKNIVTLKKWDFPYLIKGKMTGQSTQQNVSIRKYSRHKWMLHTDLDEYVYGKLTTILNKYETRRTRVSGLTLPCMWFGCSHHETFQSAKSLIHRQEKANPCTKGFGPKMIVNPNGCLAYSIHRISNGLPEIHLNSEELRFNHYYTLTNNNQRYKITGNSAIRKKNKNK